MPNTMDMASVKGTTMIGASNWTKWTRSRGIPMAGSLWNGRDRFRHPCIVEGRPVSNSGGRRIGSRHRRCRQSANRRDLPLLHLGSTRGTETTARCGWTTQPPSNKLTSASPGRERIACKAAPMPRRATTMQTPLPTTAAAFRQAAWKKTPATTRLGTM